MTDTEPMPPSRFVSTTLVLAALASLIVGVGFAILHRTSTDNRSFRVAKLRGTVAEMGELASRAYHDKAYGVRLRAILCFEPSARTVESYPLEFQIAHYALSDPPSNSWGEPFRTVADSANWIVSFGETIDKCGEVVLEDVLPDSDYKGVESDLGIMTVPAAIRSENDLGQCYGVELRVRARFESQPCVMRHASGRAIVRCGSLLASS
jgi:hypothetical protein